MADMKLVIEPDADGVYREKYIPLSKAEIAQRKIDAAAAEEARLAREAEETAQAEAKAAAIAKAVELGLSDAEIAALTA